MKFKHSAVGLGVALLLGTAQAQSSYSLNLEGLGAGAPASGTVGGSFSALALGIDLASISNVHFTAWFNDDASDASTLSQGAPGARAYTGYVYESGYYNSSTGTNIYNYARTGTATVDRQVQVEGEGFSVEMGGSTVGSAATAQTTSTSTSTEFQNRSFDSSQGSPGYWSSCGRNCGSYWVSGYSYNYYTDNFLRTDTTTTDATGAMSVSFDLASASPSALAAFMASGVLQTTFALTGDALFGGATLTFEAREAVAAAPVPEPSTYALMGVGLLAMGGYARRRRREG